MPSLAKLPAVRSEYYKDLRSITREQKVIFNTALTHIPHNSLLT